MDAQSGASVAHTMKEGCMGATDGMPAVIYSSFLVVIITVINNQHPGTAAERIFNNIGVRMKRRATKFDGCERRRLD